MSLLNELPDFIDPEAFSAWVEMRKKTKKPLTDYARKLAIRKLAKFHADGMNVLEVIEQSILNCWQDFWPIKPQAQLNTGDAWLAIRAAIRDQREPEDPKLRACLKNLGGLYRLGEMTSFEIERKRPDFDAAYKQQAMH